MLSSRHARHGVLWAAVRPHLEGRDLAHDAAHVLRVYAWALRLADEAGADRDLAGAAALVHDLDRTPKNDPARPQAGARSAALAAPLLAAAGYDERETEIVTCAVSRSNWSAGLAAETALGAVLQDADRLDALGAIGIARVFACHQAMHGAATDGAFYSADDPTGEHGRPLDDARFALDHFFVKLLRLAEGMRFPASRAEAARRHAVLVQYARDLLRELGLTNP